MAACHLVELTRCLMMYQQNSYRNERYMKWLSTSGDTTSIPRLIALVLFFLSISLFGKDLLTYVSVSLFGAIMGVKLATKRYKKPLVWTARVIRLYVVAVIVSGLIVWGASYFMNIAAAALLAYCLSHVLVMASGILLSPVDRLINKRYINDARRRLKSMPDLKIIGITGSYGKTSTKHYLHRIFSEQFDTLMTPGSFNTTLGVVRTVREYLKPYNEVFIVEMGAKQPGDIKEICDLVHPTIGIVTAVGPQHLESFKTIERVQATKFELVDALPADGVAVVNNDFEKIADRPVDTTKCLRYAINNVDAGYRAENIVYSPSGTTFEVVAPDGWHLSLHTRLLGECNVSDLLAAIVTAHVMGVPDAKIISAVAAIEPVEHRLSVKKTPSGIIILDDAFNSNPIGSRMALEVLGSMTSGKRIVITPGMIELGEQQYDLNSQLGQYIDKNVDVAIVVGQYNREAILAGITEGGRLKAEQILVADSFAEAQRLLATVVASGDIVLYENDLPDTFK